MTDRSGAGVGGHRVVLLGASNLTRGISTVLSTSRLLLGTPLEVYAAMGHGRSYGMRSRVAVRSLPGILQCGLWDALPDDDAPVAALITDVGNDIVYGADPATIVTWVEQCIDRLRTRRARIVMTLPPIASLRRIRPWHFAIVKNAMFPTRTLEFEDAMRRAGELDERLQTLGRRHGVPAVALPRSWYGFDPIHIARRVWPAAWMTQLEGWTDDAMTDVARPAPRQWLRLRTAMPQRWWLLGRPRRSDQPVRRLADGTVVSLY